MTYGICLPPTHAYQQRGVQKLGPFIHSGSIKWKQCRFGYSLEDIITVSMGQIALLSQCCHNGLIWKKEAVYTILHRIHNREKACLIVWVTENGK